MCTKHSHRFSHLGMCIIYIHSFSEYLVLSIPSRLQLHTYIYSAQRDYNIVRRTRAQSGTYHAIQQQGRRYKQLNAYKSNVLL